MVSLLGTIIPTADPVWFRRQIPDGPDGPTFGEAMSGYGRWERTSRQIQTPEGRVVLLTGTVYVPAAWEPKVGDQLAQGGGAPDWRRVEMVETLTWFDGTVMHHEVHVS
ncbi:hypothetical protein [Prauserella endophytica]|uniref:Uncharacterized protein n=1 Tax=Prauserella endophytica TaxID=1592324 RepID=A0ABY2S041_9PSEU|nr:hypothetical protein [Prauserella endophytica]PXY20314.1 hypothetical protein BAY59_31230 [Prauserella coralliicola]TKG66916.1 hypothetical protein FCN18_23675 [Prauserella endophytica]